MLFRRPGHVFSGSAAADPARGEAKISRAGKIYSNAARFREKQIFKPVFAGHRRPN
jgi:hypothetical protein